MITVPIYEVAIPDPTKPYRYPMDVSISLFPQGIRSFVRYLPCITQLLRWNQGDGFPHEWMRHSLLCHVDFSLSTQSNP